MPTSVTNSSYCNSSHLCELFTKICLTVVLHAAGYEMLLKKLVAFCTHTPDYTKYLMNTLKNHMEKLSSEAARQWPKL